MPLMQEGALPLIQLAVTPVILITGLGSLLLTMTNRLARIVDRTRILAGQMRTTAGEEREHVALQLRIMYRRAKVVRMAVTLAASSMFISGLLVVVIFTSALIQRDWASLIVALFILSILFLLGALAFFIRDIFMSLIAVGAEVERVTRPDQEEAKAAAIKVAKSS
ncbi:MAG TPA: DUF2721 domain-containing protein [Opitutaceae bacterium]|nr:DUF2721 domain-containing protein [Opitutaceae bacterium]